MQVSSSRARVPAEHRFLGLDKRSFPHALFVVAVFLVATVVIPRVDGAIGWDDPVEAGEELALSATITITPTTGWNVEEGFRAPQDGVPEKSGGMVVTSGGVVLSVVPDTFSGTPAQLLAQVAKVTSSTEDPSFTVSGATTTVSTASGEVGVLQPYSSVRGDGVVAAFVIDGTGLKVTAHGPPAQMREAAADLHAMITSIRAVDAEERTS